MNEKIKIGTIFSGIGAAEFALRRLKIPHEILFACDNGELEYSIPEMDVESKLSIIKNPRERKAFLDILMGYSIGIKLIFLLVGVHVKVLLY